MKAIINVDADELKTLFDIATSSMDFSSGFLDNGEVDVLRHFAELLDIDVKEATPDNFRASYAHDPVKPYRKHKTRTQTGSSVRNTPYGQVSVPVYTPGPEIDICGWCRRALDNPVHHGVSVVEPTRTYET